MANKRQYSIADFTQAIAKVGANVTTLAVELNCSRSTVYAYRRKHPEIAAALEGAGAAVDDSQKQYPREKFEQAIRDSNGILQKVADKVGCSRQTVYNALEQWEDLRELFHDSRESLVDEGESTIVAMMRQRDDLKVTLSAATYVTSRLGKKRGWTERSEVTGADGAGLFDLSDETLALARQLGIEPSKVAAQFEQMVRAAAVKAGLVE